MNEVKYLKKPTKIILIKPEYNLIIKYSSSKREETVGLYLTASIISFTRVFC